MTRRRVSPDRTAAAQRRRERTILTWGLILILALIVAITLYGFHEDDGNRAFAACLTDAGAAMYGTDRCPHCQEQKRLFGKAFAEVTYYNCDYARECIEQNISRYPTWIFADGSRLYGRQDLAVLAEKTQCTALLPAQ